jgi:hypothetical protein
VDQNFHGTDDQLESYVLGRMSDLDIPVFEEHLVLCPACRDRLDTVEHFVLGMRETLADEHAFANPVSTRKKWFAWLPQPALSLAVAAVAIVAVIGFFSMRPAKLVPVATLALTANRGDVPVTLPARELDLSLSDAPPQGAPFRVEVVDAMGRAVWNGAAAITAASQVDVQIKPQQRLSPGQYFVRLYTASGELVHEYGFRIRAA